MKFINYQALSNVMLTQKPFRGTTNEYPLVNRNYSTKRFYHETEGGSPMFRIIIGHSWQSERISKEEFDELKAKNSKYIYEYTEPTTKTSTYSKYYKTPNEIGIVRPDNTFEFTRRTYFSGDRMMMSRFNVGYFVSDAQRGGVIYMLRERGAPIKMYPIFQGLRIDCDTMQPDPKHTYELIGRRVARAEAKKFVKQYEDFYKMAATMMATMDYPKFCELALEIGRPILSTKATHPNYNTEFGDRLWNEFKNVMNDSPLEAAALACIALNVRNMFWDTFHSPYRRASTTMEGMFEHMRRSINTRMYGENPEVMTEVPFEFGKPYPASNWDYTIRVDGVDVVQC